MKTSNNKKNMTLPFDDDDDDITRYLMMTRQVDHNQQQVPNELRPDQQQQFDDEKLREKLMMMPIVSNSSENGANVVVQNEVKYSVQVVDNHRCHHRTQESTSSIYDYPMPSEILCSSNTRGLMDNRDRDEDSSSRRGSETTNPMIAIGSLMRRFNSCIKMFSSIYRNML